MKPEDYTIPCKNQGDLEAKRNAKKRELKEAGTFSRAKKNTVYDTHGNTFTFYIEAEAPDIDDESLPKEAFGVIDESTPMTGAKWKALQERYRELV